MTTPVLLVKKESNTRPFVRPRQFNWVYFLKSKDETTPILKDFIRQTENQFNHKGSRGNIVMPELYKNGVAERKNMTLIEAARTMLADSFLPTTFWAEAFNTACYVLNRVLVTKPQNKTPYELLTENQANKSAGPQEANNSAGTQANDDQGAHSEEINLHDEHFVLPIWSAYLNIVKSSGDKIEKNKKPDANTNSTNLLNVVSAPVSAVGPSIALNDDEPSYPDDPSMPHLEDIHDSPSAGIFTNSSYDDEGVVTDFNNLETIMNVSLTPITRIHTIHPKTQILGDPMSAVQTRSKVKKNSKGYALEELLQFQIQKVWILVDLPFGKKAIGSKWVYKNKKDERGVVVRNKARLVAQGHRQEERIDYDEVFTHHKFRNKVYKVVKALYGLHQAPRAWYATLSTFLERNGYRREAIDKTLFIKKDKKDIMLVQVKQKEDGIFISQDKYVAEILKKFKFLSVKTASTSIETQKPLVKDEEAADVDVTPKTSDLQAMKMIFRYLKGQPKLGLWYPKVSSFNLESYSDSDYAGANLDKKSTTGGVNTPKCDEDSLELKELMVFFVHFVLRKMELELLLQPKAPKVPSPKPSQEHQLPSPSNDPILDADKDSLTLQELMELCIRFSNKILALESEVIDNKSSFTDRIQKLEDRVDQLEEENRALKEKSFKTTQVDKAAPAKAYNLDLQHAKKVLSMQDIDEEEPAKVEEVLEVVKAAKLFTEVATTAEPTTTTADQVPKVSALRRRRGVVIQDPEETTSSLIVHAEADEAFARQLEAELNANINWNDVVEQNMADFKMDFFKGMTYSEIRPLFEKHYNSIQAFLEKEEEEVTVQEKKQGESLKQETAKKQRIDKDTEELKRHMHIVANDDDDVALKRLNETLAEKAAKRKKLDKEIEELKRHL
nr:hypothetical protein [Tanacetum cinerariifolium]